MLLPSTVFEADESGRSYRFRPNVRSIWVRNFPMKGPVKAYFQVPDTPELAEVVKGTGAQIVDGSTQTTNSWGLRGPEPDLAAPWRGIVLGDSYMQGLFVGDHETPVECLKRDLKIATGRPGRDPQHGPPRLLARAVLLHADRIRQAVSASVRRDQHLRQRLRRLSGSAPGQGRLGGGELLAGPDSRVLLSLTRSSVSSSPPPGSIRSRGRKWPGIIPGKISNILEATGLEYLEPDRRVRQRSAGDPQPIASVWAWLRRASPLFNGRIGDGHFSGRGAEIWAAAVGRRLALLIQKRQLRRSRNRADSTQPTRRRRSPFKPAGATPRSP